MSVNFLLFEIATENHLKTKLRPVGTNYWRILQWNRREVVALFTIQWKSTSILLLIAFKTMKDVHHWL